MCSLCMIKFAAVVACTVYAHCIYNSYIKVKRTMDLPFLVKVLLNITEGQMLCCSVSQNTVYMLTTQSHAKAGTDPDRRDHRAS